MKKTNKHFIFDYETFGQNVFNCPVIDCSYFVFDWNRFLSENPYTFEELTSSIRRDKIDVEDQVKRLGRVIEKSSMEFWAAQDIKVRKKIMPRHDDITVEEHIQNMANYLSFFKKIDYWWSRSNTFDPLLMWRDSKGALDEILKFWRVRDIRTYIDSKFNFTTHNGFCPYDDEDEWKKIFEEHNSIHDVAADILRIQKIVRAENDLL